MGWRWTGPPRTASQAFLAPRGVKRADRTRADHVVGRPHSPGGSTGSAPPLDGRGSHDLGWCGRYWPEVAIIVRDLHPRRHRGAHAADYAVRLPRTTLGQAADGSCGLSHAFISGRVRFGLVSITRPRLEAVAVEWKVLGSSDESSGSNRAKRNPFLVRPESSDARRQRRTACGRKGTLKVELPDATRFLGQQLNEI